jgi:hypothetical protein
MIVDNFIESFPDLKEFSISGDFKDEVNPIDGVIYPLICKEIPKEIESEIIQRLALHMGKPIKNTTMFLRRSPVSVECPHQVHSDISMGSYSLMLYINDSISGTGTSLVRHESTGIAYSPTDEKYIASISDDQNDPDKWIITDMINAAPNRAFIFDACRLHRAEPVGGFGEGESSRVVLTCFFSLYDS